MASSLCASSPPKEGPHGLRVSMFWRRVLAKQMSARLLASFRPLAFGLLLGAACNDTADSNRPGPRGNAGAAPDDASAVDCEGFRDATTTETPGISIRNAGSVPLIVLASSADCRVAPSLVQVQRDGQPLSVQPARCSLGSCGQYLEPGPPLQEKRGGCSGGCGSLFYQLSPQQTLRQPVGLEQAQREMPARCSKQLTEGISCGVQVLPVPGNYTVVVRAFVDLACAYPRYPADAAHANDTAQPNDAGGDCACLPDSTGLCTNPYIQISTEVPNAMLTFSLATPTYFQEQQIEVSAP
jgi:hypothetical protein